MVEVITLVLVAVQTVIGTLSYIDQRKNHR